MNEYLSPTELVEVLKYGESLFPRFKPTDAEIELWHRDFSYRGASASQIRSCIEIHKRRSHFAPSLSEIESIYDARFKNRTFEAKKEHVRQYAQSMFDDGYVQVRIREGQFAGKFEWVKKKFCVQDKFGEWHQKIEFVMDHISPGAVEEALKQIVGEPKNVKWSDLCARPGWVPAYRAKLEELVTMAKAFERGV